MKVGISSTGQDLESQVDVRFGRCPYFVIVEIENKEIKSHKSIQNTAMTAGGGAGVTAAQTVANEGVKAVITGNMGPRAFGVMQQLGIEVYAATGKVKDVVQQYIDGKLTKVSAPTGPMYMGIGPGRGPGAGRGMGRGIGPGAGMGRRQQ